MGLFSCWVVMPAVSRKTALRSKACPQRRLGTRNLYRFRDHLTNHFRCFNKVRIIKVGVARRHLVPAMSEQITDDGQISRRT